MKYIILIGALFISQFGQSQDSIQNTFISQKFKGGTEAFVNAISSKLKYPKSAKENDYYAIAVVHLNIDSSGILQNVMVLNRLKYGLEKLIKHVFMESKQQWMSTQSGLSFYLSVTFSLYDNYAKIINVNYPDMISENILVNAYETEPDSLIRQKVDYRKAFQRAENGFNKNISKEYYKAAKSHLNKLIAMDPFYQEYYKNRLNIESYTKSYDYTCGDLKILDALWNIRVKKMKVKCE